MQLEVDSIVEGRVTGITKFGAFVELPDGSTGMVHISEVASSYVTEISDFLTHNQKVMVKILLIGDDGRISLSIKRAQEQQENKQKGTVARPDNLEWKSSCKEGLSFEDMMSKFKQSSEEKISDLKRVIDSKRGGSSRRGSYR